MGAKGEITLQDEQEQPEALQEPEQQEEQELQFPQSAPLRTMAGSVQILERILQAYQGAILIEGFASASARCLKYVVSVARC